ncbi:MAG: KpsF/GutQ family sugar-phosphate isomerase [Opitutales bacterium]|nr:KpsF/GutQ family sugar-phosphate isomerase [Opitutales bacterium]
MDQGIISAAKAAMQIEADALANAVSKIDDNFEKALQILMDCEGKIVFCGIGKSGLVAQKLAATFSSMGSRAVFMHATEAVHGDLGLCEPKDAVVMISKSGSTAECLRIIPILKALGCKIVSIVGNMDSPMAGESDAAIDAGVEIEADPLGLAPTSSSTLAMAFGDALSCALSKSKNFTKADFAKCHPAGQLGRNLTIKVSSVMHGKSECAFISKGDSIRQAVIAMTQKPLGAACVVDGEGRLIGIATDGDIRRMLQNNVEIDSAAVESIMTKTPITVGIDADLGRAASLMEDRPSKLSVLPVVDRDFRALGLIRLHDIYQPTK